MKTIILAVFLISTALGCSSSPKKQTYTQEQAEAIYKKGLLDAKPKPIVLFGSGQGIDKIVGDFYYTSYQASNGGGFSMPVSCEPKLLGNFDTKANAYKLYRGIAKAFCPKADFSEIENQNKAVVKKIVSQANSSDEK